MELLSYPRREEEHRGRRGYSDIKLFVRRREPIVRRAAKKSEHISKTRPRHTGVLFGAQARKGDECICVEMEMLFQGSLASGDATS